MNLEIHTNRHLEIWDLVYLARAEPADGLLQKRSLAGINCKKMAWGSLGSQDVRGDVWLTLAWSAPPGPGLCAQSGC